MAKEKLIKLGQCITAIDDIYCKNVFVLSMCVCNVIFLCSIWAKLTQFSSLYALSKLNEKSHNGKLIAKPVEHGKNTSDTSNSHPTQLIFSNF